MNAVARIRAIALVFVLAGLGLCVGTVVSAPAHAQSSGTVEIAMPQRGIGFTSGTTPPLLDVRTLAPGGSVAGVMEIRNTSGSAENISLRMVNVKAIDACPTHAEPCGGASASLLSVLRFKLDVAERGFGSGSVPLRQWSGTASALQARRGIPVGTNVEDRGVRWIRLTAWLPSVTGNRVQYGAVAFDLDLNMDGAQGGSTHVIGPSGGNSGGNNILGTAATGTQVLLQISAGIVLLIAGLILLLTGRRHRRQMRGAHEHFE